MARPQAEPEALRLLKKKGLKGASREELAEAYENARDLRREFVRRAVFSGHDEVLLDEVLGMQVEPKLHKRMIDHQRTYPRDLCSAYRGSGKTTTRAVGKCIGYVIRNPNIRILIASSSEGKSRKILHGIKQRLESNEELIGTFGSLVGDGRWDSSSIEIAGRNQPHMEPTIATVGIEGAVEGGHYDVIIVDDLITFENSRTQLQRDKVKDWYYRVLEPCLMAPHSDFPDRGQLHYNNTLYHPQDLTSHLMENEMSGTALVLPVWDEAKRPLWPSEHPKSWIEQKRRENGLVNFASQFLCNLDPMKGSIFRFEDCQTVSIKEFPKNIPIFIGVDLAISLKRRADKFAMVAIGIDPRERIWTQAFFKGQLSFHEQTEKILEWGREFEPIRVAVEANAYQAAQYQMLRQRAPWLNVIPIITKHSKTARANRLAGRFESGSVFFKPNQTELIDELVVFRGDDSDEDDLFDAFDLAVTASQRRARRRKRESEPGVI